MKGLTRLHLAVIGGVLAVVAALAVFSVSALAASPSPTPTPKAGSGPQAAACTTFRDNFAKAIGKSTADVDKAFTSALNQTLADQVKAGKITQAQADQIKQKGSTQTLCGPGFLGGKPDGMRGPGKPGDLGGMGFGPAPDMIAAALGITGDELKADFAKGMTVHQIADSKGVTQAQFNASLLAAEKAKLAAAVAAGKITQAQADAILQHQPAELGSHLWDATAPHRGGGVKPGAPAPAPTPTSAQ